MFWKWTITLLLTGFLLGLQPAEAVKSYLFKTCDQSGFCNRNRHFASQVTNQGSRYESRYAVDMRKLQIEPKNGQVDGHILKQLNDGSTIPLSFEISIIEGYNLRLKIDEVERAIEQNIVNHVRYNETANWALVDEPRSVSFDHTLDNEKLILSYGEYVTSLQFYPFQITVSYKGKPEIVFNDRNFLNIEHYRTKKQQDQENSIHVAPEESSFDTYKDSFKDCKNVKVPLGPESVAVDVTLLGFEHVFGIPEHADSLSLKDTTESEPYRLFNVDVFEYETQSRQCMYGSIPFLIGAKKGASAGVFWLNSADTYVDIKKIEKPRETAEQQKRIVEPEKTQDGKVQTHWISENGVLDVVLFVKDTPLEVSQSYSSLTGYPALPNLFSLGYHQSRWNYNDEQDVLDITAKFDENLIPFDTIWLDVEYTDQKKYFTWKKELFPDPDRMMGKLDETGRTLVAIIDPHLKVGYEVSDAVDKLNLAMNKSDGEGAYHGHCWPGESIWIDTFNPQSRPFWDKQFENGSSFGGYATNLHIWNDMNEPSIFNGPETTSPKDTIHYGGWEHRSVHNVYSLTYHEATYDAMIKRNPNIRPFILTRGFYSGSQRTSAVWTGDNMAKWEYLKESIPMVLTLNIVGYQFSGADVAGFFGNPEKELLTRWYQTGIWYPFFRGHAHIDSRRHEPWVAGEPYTSIMRDAIKLRYKLLPSLYTQFYKSSIGGDPIMRPLFYETPENTETYAIDDEFFVDKLLVKPVTAPGQDQVGMYLPDNEIYYDFYDFTRYQGQGNHQVDAPLEKIPILIKSGSVIPIKERYRRSSKLMKLDPYTLYVTLNSVGEATGELYIDDGESFNNAKENDYLYIGIEAKDGVISSKILEGRTDGAFTQKLDSVKVEKIVLLGAQSHDKTNKAQVEQDGQKWTVDIVDNSEYLIIRNPAVSINKSWQLVF